MKKNLGAWALAALALLASCSDKDIVANVTIPEELEQVQNATGTGTGLESYSYAIPFEVVSDSEWTIEFDEAGEEIAYAHPTSGKGNATVKLYILDNLTDEARQGTMTVVFPEDNSKNKVITLKQKSKNGSDDNFSAESVGNITYGVGYGFNVVTGVGARAIKSQIIKAQLLVDEKLVQKAATSSTSAEIHTYTGSTVKELTSNFTSTFDGSGKGWGIEAEANSKFDMNNYSKEEYQYAMSFVDVCKEEVTVILHEDEWCYWDDLDEGCYTKAAYKAINGENRKYPSDNAGFKKLFDSYGTHVIRTATLGGRLTIATTINTADITDDYNLDAFAKLSYSGVIDVSGDVKEEYKNSFKSNSSACQTKISALGGSSSIFNDLNDLIGDGAKNAANAWFNSLNDDEATWTFIGIDDMENLVPLWDLVEDGERAELMQKYFESGQYAEDTYKGVSYDMGVQARLEELPEFDEDDTQIVDVKIGDNNNKTVARICNEFIPQLDEVEPVKVIYPVVKGQVKWNMGWFAGNSVYPPHHVVNTNGVIKVEIIDGESIPEEDAEIYIRGVRIGYTPVDDETEAKTAAVTPYYAVMPKGDKIGNYNVVKILNKIWMAENFAGTFYYDTQEPIKDWVDGDIVKNDPAESGVEGEFYYYDTPFWEANRCAEGWYNLTKDSFDDVFAMLKQYDINVAQAFSKGGCLGFNGEGGYCYKTNMLFEDSTPGELHTEYFDTKNFYHLVSTLDIETLTRYHAFFIDFERGAYDTYHVMQNDKLCHYVDGVYLPSWLRTPIRCYKPIQ